MNAPMPAPLRAFIAEDEPPARERLTLALARVAPQLSVVGHADSVRGTQQWLARHPPPDLLLLDIQLADGLSLELFADGELTVPTVFTTAYDRFAIDAFRALALKKVERLRRSFGAEVAGVLQQAGSAPPKWRQRLVGRKGSQFHALTVEELAYVVSVDKLVFAVDQRGERYLLETPLAELEAALDPTRFFRASRQVLLAADGIESFAPAGKGKLSVMLKPTGSMTVVISQERAGAFRAWVGG